MRHIYWPAKEDTTAAVNLAKQLELIFSISCLDI